MSIRRTARRLLAAVVLLTLSRCGPPPVIVDDHDTVPRRMSAIAHRLDLDRRTGGVTGVVADLQQCYQDTTFLVIRAIALRDCLVLDYSAYSIDVAMNKRMHWGATPFFETATASARWTKYEMMAQFLTPQEFLGYMHDTNALVEMNLAQMNADPVIVQSLKPPGKTY